MKIKNKIYLSIIAGIIATAVMSLLIFLSPYFGFPRISVWEIIANLLNIPLIFGWIIHFLVGIFFAFIYLSFFKRRLPGNSAIKGMIFSLLPFFLSQTASLFSSNFITILGSLIGHLVYGAVLGLMTKE